MKFLRHYGLAIAGGVVILLWVFLWFVQPGFIRQLDNTAFDIQSRYAAGTALSGEVAIVDIDEASLKRYGRWPWSRATVAGLISQLEKAGASVIALDIVFAEPESTAVPSELSGGEISGGKTSPADIKLAGAVAGSRVVLGHYFRFGNSSEGTTRYQDEACSLHPVSTAVVSDESGLEEPFFNADGVVCSLAEFTRVAAGSGFLNASPDSDGVMRRIPLLISYRERAYPSLALAAVMAHRNVRTVRVQQGKGGVEWVQAGGIRVAAHAETSLTIRFCGPRGTIPHYSAAALPVESGALRNKIIIVGGAAVGLTDSVMTPISTNFPGSEVHATVVENLLSGNAFDRSATARLVELILVILGGGLAAILLLRFGPFLAAAGVLAMIALLWLGAGFGLSRLGDFVSPVTPILSILSVTAVLAVLNLSLQGRRADKGEASAEAARQFMVAMLASVAKERDLETGDHLLRMQRYTWVLGVALASNSRFREALTPENIDLVSELVAIHDIGKLAIPIEILQKPGKLTPAEYEMVKSHVARGRDALAAARAHANAVDERLFELSWQIVAHHHERWDGSGYPEGLRGEEISPVGRMVALVDVYDALVNERVYKAAISHEEAMKIIKAERGKHFDPVVVDTFLRVEEAFARITAEFSSHAKTNGKSRRAGGGVI